MTDWYVSSVAWATITAFQVSHAYVLGSIIRPTNPGLTYAFLCTTAGTSASTEPGWPSANNSTVTTGTVTFTNISGQSAYGWTAVAGTINTINNRYAAGDRVFLSSDHSESTSLNITYTGGTVSAPLKLISVNRFGNVPPTTADIQPGVSLSQTNGITFSGSMYCNGITFLPNNFTYSIAHKFENCVLGSNQHNMVAGTTLRLVNTQIKSQFNPSTNCIIEWKNTAPLLVAGSSVPTMVISGDIGASVTFRGVDMSSITTTLTTASGSINVYPNQILLDSCRIAPGMVRLGGNQVNHGATVELVNCYDGTNILNERYVPAGTVVTDRSIFVSGGSVDSTGSYSQKIMTTTIVDKYVQPMEGFPLHTYNSFTGAVKNATVEIASNVAFNSDEIGLLLEYEGSSSSTLKSFIDSQTNSLVVASAVISSTADWASNVGTWSQSTLPHADNWCVAWGNNIWVAGPNTANTTFGKSIDDGVTWTTATAPSTTFACKSIAYGAGLFAAVSSTNNGQAASSPDGTTWTSRTISTASWTSVAFGNSTFVAVAATGNVSATSPDGITWTQRTLPTSASWNSVTFGNGIFVAVATGTIAATSTDGITWTQRTLPASVTWNSVIYGNSVFVAVSGPGSVAATSPDGVNWTAQVLPSSVAWTSVAYGNGLFVAVASSTTTIATSNDGITWSANTVPVGDFGNIAYGGSGEFIAVPFFSAAIAAVLFQPAIAQKLTISFTPLKAGWVRGTVRLSRPSAKVWHDGNLNIV